MTYPGKGEQLILTCENRSAGQKFPSEILPNHRDRRLTCHSPHLRDAFLPNELKQCHWSAVHPAHATVNLIPPIQDNHTRVRVTQGHTAASEDEHSEQNRY